MSCEDFEQRLNEVLDDRLDPAADRLLVEHSQRCPECQRLLALQSQCFAALHGALNLSPSLGGRSLLGETLGQAESLGTDLGHCLPAEEKGCATVRAQQAKRGGHWKRWSAMVSPLAVSAALAVVMWTAGQRPSEQRPSEQRPSEQTPQNQAATSRAATSQASQFGGTRGSEVSDRGGWRGAGVLAWSVPRGRVSSNARDAAASQLKKSLAMAESDVSERGQADRLAASAVPASTVSEEAVSVAMSTPVASGLVAGARGVRRIAGEADLLFGERLNQWRGSIVVLPTTPLESVSYWAEGMRPVADSVGSLVEAVRESVLVGRSDQSESSLDTTWVIDAKWVA
jgi:hypothetical protein